VQTIQQPNIALETIGEYKPELILLDMNFTIDTSGKQGIRLLEMIRADFPKLSHGTIRLYLTASGVLKNYITLL